MNQPPAGFGLAHGILEDMDILHSKVNTFLHIAPFMNILSERFPMAVNSIISVVIPHALIQPIWNPSRIESMFCAGSALSLKTPPRHVVFKAIHYSAITCSSHIVVTGARFESAENALDKHEHGYEKKSI